MSWPLVSRRRLEDAERANAWLKAEISDGLARLMDEHEDRVADHDRYALLLEREHARYDLLLEKFTALRLAGAAPPEPKEPPAPKAQPDPVTQAIIARSGNSRFLRKHYNEFVREQRALNVDEAEIAKAILDGESSAADEGVPA